MDLIIIFIAGWAIVTSLTILTYIYIKNQNEKVETLKDDQDFFEQEIEFIYQRIDDLDLRRKDIAQDLHDRLGSMLSTIKILLGSMDTKIDLMRQENKAQYQKANHLIDEVCDEIRRIAYSLQSDRIFDAGLNARVKNLVETINKTQSQHTELFSYGLNDRLNPKMEQMIYSMLRELIRILLKHNECSKLFLHLNQLDDNIIITLENDTNTPNVDPSSNQEENPFSRIIDSIKMLGGSFRMESPNGHGKVIYINFPTQKFKKAI